jgi:hypothetical protein
MVRYDGNVTWLSTVIFKSSCTINVRYFPFDEQMCDMIFASWSFDGFSLDININTGEGDVTNYIKNGEWHLVKLIATKYLRIYSCCEEPFPEVYYKLVIRRRPLYYVFNMVFPCLLITLVAFLGFYLPPDSSEKVSIGITTLLSLTVFLMLVAESMPPTSEQLPLLGIYYAVTITIVSFSTAMAVLTLNINNKGSKGRKVPRIVKIILLHHVAKILGTELSSVKKYGINSNTETTNNNDNEIKKSSKKKVFKKSNTTDALNLNEINENKNTSKLINNVKYKPVSTIEDNLNKDISENSKSSETTVYLNNNNNKNKNFSSKNILDSSETLTNLSETKLLDNSIYYNLSKNSDGLVLKASEEDINLTTCSTQSNENNYLFCLANVNEEENKNDAINNNNNNNNNKNGSKQVNFEKTKPARPTSILKNGDTPFVSKFDMLSESFNRGSFNSFSVLYPQTPLTPCNLHCICDCSLNSLNVTSTTTTTNNNNKDNCSAQSFLISNNSSKLKSITTPTNDNISKYDNEDCDITMHTSNNNGSPSIRFNKRFKSSFNSKLMNSTAGLFRSNQLGQQSSKTFNQDAEFLHRLESILEKQFSPLVKMLTRTLEQNQSKQIEQEKYQKIQDEWSDVALVCDHFLCFFFPFLTFLTCFIIFFNSPHVLTSW